MATFFDTHAHLDGPSFAADLPQVIERAGEAGIVKIISIGTDLESSRRAIEIAERFPNVFAVVGWHPSDAHLAPEDWRPQLTELARHPKVVALGETGLDYFRLPSKREGGSPTDDEPIKARQAELFRQHLEVAADLGLNCVIHQRDSMEDTIAQLQPFASRVKAVFHCFAGPDAALAQILEMGSLVSYTGILTFKNGQNVRDALAATPIDRFMLETDSPYLAPIPFRGKRCEPAYVRETSLVAAEVKKSTMQELSAATCSTAQSFFKGL